MTDHGRKERKTRISPQVRQLLNHLVLDGWTLAKSTETVGWTLDWAQRLLKRPDVLALRKELLQGVLSASASRAAKKVDDLMESAASSAVQLDAAQFLLGCEGIAPVSRSESLHVHQGGSPGLIIQYGVIAPEMLEGLSLHPGMHAALIEAQPRDVARIEAPKGPGK